MPNQSAPGGISKDKAGQEIYNPKQCPCCKKETILRVMQVHMKKDAKNCIAAYETITRSLAKMIDDAKTITR